MIRYSLKVEGLKCSNCDAKLESDIKNAFGVKKVSASHEDGHVDFKCARVLSDEELRKAVGFHGYTLVEVERKEEKGIFDFLRK